MKQELWSASPSERLKNARSLTESDIRNIQLQLIEGCPVDPWPYGNPTSINPYLVVLGVSPGNSPADNDANFRLGELPLAGTPHSGVYYNDSRKYWDKIRFLAESLMNDELHTSTDVLSLLGQLNLSIEQSGVADAVNIKNEFAEWVLHLIWKHLRPRVLVLVGLRTKLKADKKLAALFEDNFTGLDLRKPKMIPFIGYKEKNLVFREWNITGPHGNDLKIVDWPQHPSRAPFVNFDIWETACGEFSEAFKRK